MVVDIRKDLLQWKPKSSVSPNDPNLVREPRDSHPPEDLAGPSSPPFHYDPLVYNIQNSLSREAQPRPLRVPCSACTFVPSHHDRVNLARSGLRCRSQAKHTQVHPAHGVCGSDEEPCAEDIAASYSPYEAAAGNVAPLQPIKVACSACTSSLRAPLFHGHHAAAPKVKPRKRGKCPALCTVGTMLMETAADCPVQDLPADCVRAAATDYGWFVRPEQVDSSSANVQRPLHSVAPKEKKGLNYMVPVEARDFQKVERVEGNNAYECIKVTYQATCSCEPISDRSHEEINLAAAGKVKHDPHDCFVKRVERACAKVSRSKSGVVEIISSFPSASRHEQHNCVKKPHRRQRRVSSMPSNHMFPEAWVNPVEVRASVVYDHHLSVPAAAPDHSDTGKNVTQAVPGDAPFCMAEKSKEENNAIVKPPLHYEKEMAPDNLQTSKSASQDDRLAVVQGAVDATAAVIRNDDRLAVVQGVVDATAAFVRNDDRLAALQQAHSTAAAADRKKDHVVVVQRADIATAAIGRKNDQKMNTSKAAAMKKRSVSVDSSRRDCDSALQTSSDDWRTQPVVNSAIKMKKSSREEAAKKDQPLQLSVEVFPSPSAPKGFGLKIVQHFPKNVEVKYVNGLGLSPRSFQTVACKGCTSSCPPLD